MGRARQNTSEAVHPPDTTFINLAEQVKLPFQQILHAAEMLERGNEKHSVQTITLAAQEAIRLIDGYLLSVLLQQEAQLLLEPVSLSSVLYDTAQRLDSFAKAHGCELRLDIRGRYGPVMGQAPAIEAALTGLGHTFIAAAGRQPSKAKREVMLGLQRNPGGIRAGVFAAIPELTPHMLEQARQLSGAARQPLAPLDSGNAGGVFIADRLFSSLRTELKPSRQTGMNGLGATFLPSRQLCLV